MKYGPARKFLINYFIEIFAVRQYIRYQMIVSDSPQYRSFPFLYGTIASQKSIASGSAGECRRKPARNDNRELGS